ncbi:MULTISPECIES: chaplin family protein [Nocardiopsis]|uniref:Chaplin domain-containing protein n=1 Tax=Nocardiopsis sinuspersici TaxID=501010 RepID=A0A1V3C750_9ACTN|nr:MULTISPECIES: chaplin family protein [Nocardiopsis]OOC56575.1 hypothetical protein NOSIN_24370 [Nocardiopsis sinuspersici]
MTYTTHARIAALVAAGFIATTGGIAYADTTTSGNGSLGGGNQFVLDGDIPVNLCGNAIAVLGVAGANCTGSGAQVSEHGDSDVATSGNGSVLGGNQAVVEGDVPVNACGNAVSAVGAAGANCTDSGAGVTEEPEDPKHPEKPKDPEEPKHPEEPKDPEEPKHPEEPKDPKDPEEPKHPEEPKDPGYGETPEEDTPGGGDEVPSEEPTSPPADDEETPAPELALTGTDGGALSGLLATAAAAIAAGVGLVLAGRRRRARA